LGVPGIELREVGSRRFSLGPQAAVLSGNDWF